VSLLRPGYDFLQKNSWLQAVLGADKQSTEMQALRKHAHQFGNNTSSFMMMQPVRKSSLQKATGMRWLFR